MTWSVPRPIVHGACIGTAAVIAIGGLVGASAPPVLPTTDAGRFVWHDLMTENMASSQTFYRLAFGWEFQTIREAEPAYAVIKYASEYIGGMVTVKRRDPAEPVSQWLSYIAVNDPDAAVRAATAEGARVLKAPFDVANVGRAAIIADPQGAPVGFARFSKPRPDHMPVAGAWLWADYVATDTAAAMAFYGKIVGYGNEQVENQGNAVYHVLTLGKPRAGLFKNPFEGVRANWLPYILVDDPADLATRVQQLGGTILVAPRPDLRKGTLAIVADPGGAVIALQKYPIV